MASETHGAYIDGSWHRGEHTFAVPPGQEASHGYAIGFGVLLAIVAGVVAIPIGFVIVTVAARRGSLRT